MKVLPGKRNSHSPHHQGSLLARNRLLQYAPAKPRFPSDSTCCVMLTGLARKASLANVQDRTRHGLICRGDRGLAAFNYLGKLALQRIAVELYHIIISLIFCHLNTLVFSSGLGSASPFFSGWHLACI